MELCSNKTEINFRVKIKVDPVTGYWYVKETQSSHNDTFED